MLFREGAMNTRTPFGDKKGIQGIESWRFAWRFVNFFVLDFEHAQHTRDKGAYSWIQKA